MTKAQLKWLKILQKEKFVSWGSWGCGQRNRPLRKLIELGYAIDTWGPKNSCLQVQGVMLNEI